MKILVGYIEDLRHSGIDKYLLNVLKVAQEIGVQLDFLTSAYSKEAEDYLNQFGCKVFQINNLKKPQMHYADVKRILADGKYDKAYFNISEPLNMMGAKAAHDSGVFTVIHSHAAGMDIENKCKRLIRGVINFLCRLAIGGYGDELCACSQKAAMWLFPRKAVKSNRVKVIYNAIDVSRFSGNKDESRVTRSKMNIPEEAFVLGHIGNFCYAKNNFFLVDIIKEVTKTNPNAVMLCVGDGQDRESVEKYAEEKGVLNNMKFLGIRTDVPNLLDIMDVFCFPSRVEGLGIAVIEAQVAGVPCVVSENVDDLAIISKESVKLPINSAKPWADKALEIYYNKTKATLKNGALSKFSFEESKGQLVELLGGKNG